MHRRARRARHDKAADDQRFVPDTSRDREA